ncbi:hypothetical protein O3M35_004912 [Rhynocoris fuscipes]|uniref:Uncharacterized protein n=1 Tax=Rhynocoris fuscipes TaxID=488301 RepID=A0AAW1DNH4_9HEMI
MLPLLIFLLLFNNLEASAVNGKHVIVNGSLEKVQLSNESIKEDQIKRVNPPPIVEVIHGKVNSVIHEIRGSIDDIPPLFTETKQKDELLLPTHLKQNTVTNE